MEKKLYELLNEMELDVTEYEDMEWSSAEKEAAKQRILRKVRKMGTYTKKKKRKNGKWKIAAGAAAACALLVGAVGLANPILAKTMLGGVFGRLIESVRGEKYEEEKTAVYSKIGEKSVEAEAELAKRTDGEEAYAITAEDQGITISISDIYCDGYVLYYTAMLQTDDAELNRADGILTASKEAGSDMLKIEGMDMSGASQAFHKSDDNVFVSANEINLLSETDDGAFDAGEDNTVIADWTITNLTGQIWDSWNEQGEYESTGRIDGEWRLHFPVTVDTSENESYAIDREESGIIVKDVVKTKAGLVVRMHFPDFRKEPYNDPYNDPYIAIKDAQGNALQWMSQRYEENADGTTDSWIMVLYNGEKDLSLEVTKKDADETRIADIAFQIP